jgi:acyl carrier protein
LFYQPGIVPLHRPEESVAEGCNRTGATVQSCDCKSGRSRKDQEVGMEERKLKIKAFLLKYFRQRDLHDDDDIFALGFVNSLMALQLVNFLQKEFAITIEDEDLDIDNFRTINNMNSLLERKAVAIAIPD